VQRALDLVPRRLRPASRTATLLLTGFGPFPGVPANQTKRLVTRLALLARRRWPGLHVVPLTLPTEWVRAPLLVDAALDRWQPEVALHFGVSGAASGFDIECRALNGAKPMRDAIGLLPVADRLDSSGRHLLDQGHATALLARLRREGHCARLSDDAGGYLCNAVYYHSLKHARLYAPGRVVAFIHVPKRHRADQKLDGALTIVEAALAAAGPALARRLR
jgi:pyroglutamyl-peptidase